jgi:transcriptional regulator with XRE-family HTH domain
MAATKKITHEISTALRDARLAKRFSQEDFALVSGRTYISELERGVRQPTLAKVDDLADTLGLHPLTILSLAYLKRRDDKHLDGLAERVGRELRDLGLLSTEEGPATPPQALRRGGR